MNTNNNLNETSLCSLCHQPISQNFYFCPNCGSNLKEKPAPISIPMQIGLYAFSILLPPLGLWPGAKYVMKKSSQARRVGLIIIVLTLLSTTIMIWQIFSMFDDYINQINSAITGF